MARDPPSRLGMWAATERWLAKLFPKHYAWRWACPSPRMPEFLPANPRAIRRARIDPILWRGPGRLRARPPVESPILFQRLHLLRLTRGSAPAILPESRRADPPAIPGFLWSV